VSRRPIGYFVHHQGRGHAERCAALLAALPEDRPVTVFCARPAMLPPLPVRTTVIELPSLFEPTGGEACGMDRVPAPDTVHCAPLGWPGIRRAMAVLAAWFDQADPALLLSDVSAEVAQLARLCSVPHVCTVQHGQRDDPGHRAAWDGAAGLLAPFDRSLAQRDWQDGLLDRTHFAPGLGGPAALPDRAEARARLGIAEGETVHLVLSGNGGDGFASAALGVAARTFPHVRWHTIGGVRSSWHATEPANLVHHGWVDDALDRIVAADLIISTAGNTACQQVLAAGRPWIVVPEWCYFDEQVCKARALGDNGLAHVLSALPSHARGWREAIAAAGDAHDPKRQRACVRTGSAAQAADWLDRLCVSLWQEPGREPGISVLTIARGRDAHLSNLVLGLTRQRCLPVELIIGVMQPQPYDDLPEAPFPIRQITVAGEALPLSEARNAVARAASCDSLVFLDVDCIPAPELVGDYARALAHEHGLLMGEVRYLPEGCAREGWNYPMFERLGVRHDHRAAPPGHGVERCHDYRCFWSLNFAIGRDAFERAGGFDEGYIGYGGEDTDFGRTLFERDIPIGWMRGARAYHQYHDQRMPPVGHLDSVLRNAERFADKWGVRTMDHWLHCFALLGLIEDGTDGLRPTGATADVTLLEALHVAGQPYASTARAIDHLERDVRERHLREHGTAAPARWFDRKRFVHRTAVDRSRDAATA